MMGEAYGQIAGIAARPVTVEVVDGAVKIGVSVRKTDENGIPFRIKAPQPDYDRFIQAGRDYENGRVNYHYHELPEVEARGARREKAMA